MQPDAKTDPGTFKSFHSNSPEIKNTWRFIEKDSTPMPKMKIKQRKDGACFTAAKKNRKEDDGSSGLLGVVNLHSNE